MSVETRYQVVSVGNHLFIVLCNKMVKVKRFLRQKPRSNIFKADSDDFKLFLNDT